MIPKTLTPLVISHVQSVSKSYWLHLQNIPRTQSLHPIITQITIFPLLLLNPSHPQVLIRLELEFLQLVSELLYLPAFWQLPTWSVSNRAHREILLKEVISCHFSTQNPLMASNITQSKSQEPYNGLQVSSQCCPILLWCHFLQISPYSLYCRHTGSSLLLEGPGLLLTSANSWWSLKDHFRYYLFQEASVLIHPP